MKSYDETFTGRSLVSFAPCGCWAAVQLEPVDLRERATRTAEFMRDAARDGLSRVENLSHEEWKALRNGVNSDLTWGCNHDPQWGGAQATHEDCPRCFKTVRLKKDGSLAKHKEWGGFVCSQEPYFDRAVTA